MRQEHACDSINSFVAAAARAQRGGVRFKEAVMQDTLRFRSLDDILFVVAVFAPVSLLLSASLALAAIG